MPVDYEKSKKTVNWFLIALVIIAVFIWMIPIVGPMLFG